MKVIIGPLLRDDLKAVAQVALDLPFTVALNQLDESTPSVPHLYTFSLASRATRVLSRGASAREGVPRVAVVGAETPLMKRFATAFATEWLAEGGRPRPLPLRRHAGGADRDAARARAQDAERGAARADSTNATLAKAYLGTIPAYATGSFSSARRRR